MSNSTTKYRFLTNQELLSLLEYKLGASPVIDELWTRLLAAEDVDNALDKAQEVFDRNMELVKELINTCPVCEAQSCIVVPEFDNIEDCLELKNH